MGKKEVKKEGFISTKQEVIPVYRNPFSFFIQGVVHQALFSKCFSVSGHKIKEIAALKIFTKEQSQETERQMRNISFGNLLCLTPESPVLLLREWLGMLLQMGWLRYEDGRIPAHFELDFHDGVPVITDKRDGEIMDYIPPAPVQYKTYKQAITGKTIVVQEGKLKSERQLFQEALFQESMYFIQNQLFVICPQKQIFEEVLTLLRQELEFFRFFSLESDFRERVEIPAFFQGVLYGSCLKSRFSVGHPWKFSVKNGAEQWTEYQKITQQLRNEISLKNGRQFNQKAKSLKNHFIMENIRKEDDFQRLIKLKSRSRQGVLQDDLFGGLVTEATSHADLTIQAEIQDLERQMGLSGAECVETMLEPGLEFPSLTNENGVFQGFDVIWGDYGTVAAAEKNINMKYWNCIRNGALKSEGITGVQLPSKWFTNALYQTQRRFWILHFPLIQVWKSADKTGVITGGVSGENKEVMVKTQTGEYIQTIHSGYFLNNPDKPVSFDYTYEEQEFMIGLEKLPLRLEEHCTLFQGVSIPKNELSTEGVLFITPAEMEPFGVASQMRYCPLSHHYLAGFTLHAPEKTIFLTQKEDGSFCVSYTNQQCIHEVSVISLQLETVEKTLWTLAFLNLPVIQKYIQLQFSHKTRIVSPRKLMEILKHLPFFLPDSENTEEINNLTLRMIREKNDRNSDNIISQEIQEKIYAKATQMTEFCLSKKRPV
ncbi:MAG: hypothetical protein K1X92_09145 [Bacteroidia bacterium]|nr:hypothetical protein [Bacteroidia bacterium]